MYRTISDIESKQEEDSDDMGEQTTAQKTGPINLY